jgi:hypothetical protein
MFHDARLQRRPPADMPSQLGLFALLLCLQVLSFLRQIDTLPSISSKRCIFKRFHMCIRAQSVLSQSALVQWSDHASPLMGVMVSVYWIYYPYRGSSRPGKGKCAQKRISIIRKLLGACIRQRKNRLEITESIWQAGPWTPRSISCARPPISGCSNIALRVFAERAVLAFFSFFCK